MVILSTVYITYELVYGDAISRIR